MIHVLNSVPEEYDVILNRLERCLSSFGSDALTMEVIHEKLNNRYEKIKRKNEEKKIGEKALATYGKQYAGYCSRCGVYGHKLTDKKYL